VKQTSAKSGKTDTSVRLKELLKEVSAYLDQASEDQRERLLTLLEDWRLGDRRRYPRKPCSISVTYTVEDSTFTDIIKNICPGGVFIETSEAFTVGQEVTVTFSPSHEAEPIACNGKIVWDGPKGIGVKFATANKALEEMIKTL
jgi:Tfp pilus assembly protein PilZ